MVAEANRGRRVARAEVVGTVETSRATRMGSQLFLDGFQLSASLGALGKRECHGVTNGEPADGIRYVQTVHGCRMDVRLEIDAQGSLSRPPPKAHGERRRQNILDPSLVVVRELDQKFARPALVQATRQDLPRRIEVRRVAVAVDGKRRAGVPIQRLSCRWRSLELRGVRRPRFPRRAIRLRSV